MVPSQFFPDATFSDHFDLFAIFFATLRRYDLAQIFTGRS
uniref:Uncharacterized protein n=1 Tax=Curvibacter symbiont subsp. Hydra magnipapillata TaxID=667019 RepID=C9YGA1_CURXX|nr:hypothetical protein Csp_B18010 [Curvibacter putative symbiont of Hydra magnipapillata]